ncbi:MAG: virulence factor family protein, partial [Elusimicrobia bacterium]|nr:virulence factor family protein [Candidatus Obscuribacterium magneticum]
MGTPDHASNVVLFLSGDGGWNLGVVEMAQSLAALNALVVGIDTNHYLKQLSFSKEKCLYLADDFELLSKFIQKKYGFLAYKEPIIVGYSSGATLVYAILAQSPPNTFLGGISMGFCPDLRIPSPLCRGNGLAVKQDGNKAFLLPTCTLQSPWIAF